VSYVLLGRKLWKNMDNLILVKKQVGKKITPDEINALHGKRACTRTILIRILN
jgi:hypothetical protein